MACYLHSFEWWTTTKNKVMIATFYKITFVPLCLEWKHLVYVNFLSYPKTIQSHADTLGMFMSIFQLFGHHNLPVMTGPKWDDWWLRNNTVFFLFWMVYIFYTAISSNHIPQNGWNPTISKNSPIAMKRNTDCPLHVLWTFLAGSGEVCMPGAVIWTMPTYVRKTTPGDEVSDLVEQTAIKSHNETWNTNCGRGTMRFYLILHVFRWIFIWSTAVDLTRCIE